MMFTKSESGSGSSDRLSMRFDDSPRHFDSQNCQLPIWQAGRCLCLTAVCLLLNSLDGDGFSTVILFLQPAGVWALTGPLMPENFPLFAVDSVTDGSHLNGRP
jgi:hypothetical protein